MVGCQKSKCSSSWPPITTFTCIVNMQTFIPAFTRTHRTKHNETKAWFSGNLCDPARKRITPIIQLQGAHTGPFTCRNIAIYPSSWNKWQLYARHSSIMSKQKSRLRLQTWYKLTGVVDAPTFVFFDCSWFDNVLQWPNGTNSTFLTIFGHVVTLIFDLLTSKSNKAFINIGLHPGITTMLVAVG